MPDVPPSVLSMMASEGVCSHTVVGWLYYCDEHDTHGNADTEGEAWHMAQAHSDFFVEDEAATSRTMTGAGCSSGCAHHTNAPTATEPGPTPN